MLADKHGKTNQQIDANTALDERENMKFTQAPAIDPPILQLRNYTPQAAAWIVRK